MKLTKETAILIAKLEYLIGTYCSNPNSYNGYTGTYGSNFRYPVFIRYERNNKIIETKTRSNAELYLESWGVEMQPEYVKTLKYKFGSNHLQIGKALINILDVLEERYGIDFNALEEKRNKE